MGSGSSGWLALALRCEARAGAACALPRAHGVALACRGGRDGAEAHLCGRVGVPGLRVVQARHKASACAATLRRVWRCGEGAHGESSAGLHRWPWLHEVRRGVGGGQGATLGAAPCFSAC